MKKGLLLLSAGIDSPVAGHLMKGKLELEAVHFKACGKHRDIAERLCRKIGIKALHVIDHKKMLLGIGKADKRLTCVMCKRMMFKAAEKIAGYRGIDFLVTGDNMGQVASQTLQNMSVIDSAVKIPVLRPLLGNDKNETIKIAREIETFDISTEPAPECFAVPKCPATSAKKEDVEKEEGICKVEKVIDDAVKGIKTIKY